MPDDPMMEAAKFVGMKALDALACGIYTHSPCSAPGWNEQNPVTTLFCTVIRGAAGADEKEWKQNVTDKLAKIDEKLDTIQQQVQLISNGVDQLLRATQLIDLKLDKILQGSAAYTAMQSIQANFAEYQRIADDLKGTSREAFLKSPRPFQDRLRKFFADLIERQRIDQEIMTIVTALTQPTVDVSSLLHNLLAAAEVKFDAAPAKTQALRNLYDTYEAYASDVLFVLHKAYLMFEHAVAFVELEGETSTKIGLPGSSEQIAANKARQLGEVLDVYNRELEWWILRLYRPYIHGVNPAFLDAFEGAREAFKRADRFTSLMLGQRYGIRGRLISMGDRFDGTLTLGGKTYPPIKKDVVPSDERVDWWVARGEAGVYDEVHFASNWSVYRYHLPDAAPGDHPIGNRLPYAAAPVAVAKSSAGAPEPAGRAAPAAGGDVVDFGSFAEVERAGGSFALLSGEWDVTPSHWVGSTVQANLLDPYAEDLAEQSGNATIGYRYPGVDVKDACATVRTQSIQVDHRAIATIQLPQVAVAIGGQVRTYGVGLDATHRRYARTVTVQTKKKIRFAEGPCCLWLAMLFRSFEKKLDYSRDDCLAYLHYDNSPLIPEHDVYYSGFMRVGFTSQDVMKRDPASGDYSGPIWEADEQVGKKWRTNTSSLGWDAGQARQLKLKRHQVTATPGSECHFRLQARMAFNVESGEFKEPTVEFSVAGELAEAYLEYAHDGACGVKPPDWPPAS